MIASGAHGRGRTKRSHAMSVSEAKNKLAPRAARTTVLARALDAMAEMTTT